MPFNPDGIYKWHVFLSYFQICVNSVFLILNSLPCWGPAPVDPGWFKGGDGVGVLGKILITDI